MKLEFSRWIFEKYPNAKFHENLFNGSRVISCGWTDGQTDLTKLIAACSNFANAPINCNWKLLDHYCWIV